MFILGYAFIAVDRFWLLGLAFLFSCFLVIEVFCMVECNNVWLWQCDNWNVCGALCRILDQLLFWLSYNSFAAICILKFSGLQIIEYLVIQNSITVIHVYRM